MSYPSGQEIWQYLMVYIDNEIGVACLMGNLYAESGLLPFRKQGDNDSEHNYPVSHQYTADVNDGTISESTFVNDSIGYGLAQWTVSSRKQGLYNISLGSSPIRGIDNLQAQLEFIVQELNDSYTDVLNTLMNATNFITASNKVLFDYEAPQDQGLAEQLKRQNYSIDIYNTYSGLPPVPPHGLRRKMPLYLYTVKQMRYKKGNL